MLLPVDTAGRVLELLLVLHSYWEFHSFGKTTYPLVFLANESYYTVDFARSMIEWMSHTCMLLPATCHLPPAICGFTSRCVWVWCSDEAVR